ncbi:hypothetical protein ALC56_06239 [Trachymyrmex septentrionalis]|uniref:Uncharacterized protein n=1 Tax=Trachymyrmex septentrionalis TaxID=34720 RepID=A0A151JX75_9HYME|nr:hypothetical protein ALC56_06239 [Trachymyrmex septentrionalis]
MFFLLTDKRGILDFTVEQLQYIPKIILLQKFENYVEPPLIKNCDISCLTNFETYNAIPNVTSTNNKFYFDTNDKIITIPEGSYELSAINKYLRAAIRHIRRTVNDNNDNEYIFDDDIRRGR